MNSIFGIKNIEFNSGLKKMTKIVRGGNCRRCGRRPLAKFNGIVDDDH